jgi:hypothetical protein
VESGQVDLLSSRMNSRSPNLLSKHDPFLNQISLGGWCFESTPLHISDSSNWQCQTP